MTSITIAVFARPEVDHVLYGVAAHCETPAGFVEVAVIWREPVPRALRGVS